jgi:hypothetical protein
MLEIHGLGRKNTLLQGYADLFVFVMIRVYYAIGYIGKSRHRPMRKPASLG